MYWVLRPIAWIFYKLFYRVKIIGKENVIRKGKCIVICNHLCKMDVFVVAALYPNKTIFLAKKEWYKNKFIAWVLRTMGSIPVDREKPSLATIKETLQVLKENKRLGIFPEGTRNTENTEIQDIKQGTAMFAVKGKALITPVIIHSKLKKFKTNYAIVGEPIDFSKYYDVRFTDEVSNECSKIILDTMHNLQAKLNEYVENKSKKKKA